MKLLHITARADWMAAARLGQYAAPNLAAEGFIHCSTGKQALAVATKYYRGQRGLVLLVIDPARLDPMLKWELPSDGTLPGVPAGELFPHIYGPLNVDAVVQILDFEPDLNGEFTLPASLELEN